MLYPVVPHTTWVLWNELGFAQAAGDLVDAPWPQVDEAALVQDEIELVLQVNGKLRGKLVVPATADQAAHRGRRPRERRGREARQRRAGEEGGRGAGAARQCRRLGARSSARSARSRSARRLASCGFHLRGDASFPFKSVFVNAPTSTPMATELERSIAAGSDTRIAADAAAAEVVLDVPVVLDDKDVLSLSSGGSVREYQLVKRVQFRLHDKTGADWMQPGEIVIRRSYTFNETQVLARDLQEQRLLREMQTDAVQQILRRLQTAKKPA